MLKSLKKLVNISNEQEKKSTDLELKLAAATLMYEVIRADGQVDEVELASMRDILRAEFKLDVAEYDELFKQAQQTAQDAISLHSFTREICESWGNAKRAELLEYLWMLALADERIDPHERHLVRKVASLLYLNESELMQSRERAKQRLGR